MGTTGQFKAAAARLERSGCGPIGPHLDGFADWLSEQGYARGSGMKKIGLAVLLRHWLEQEGIALEQLDVRQVEKFTLSQREPLSRRTEVQHTIGQLLQHLRRSLIIPPPMVPERQSQAKKRRTRRRQGYDGHVQPSRASWVLVTSGFPPRGLR